MKKLLLTSIAALTMAGSSSFANDGSGLYIGLGYASTNIDLTIENLSRGQSKITRFIYRQCFTTGWL